MSVLRTKSMSIEEERMDPIGNVRLGAIQCYRISIDKETKDVQSGRALHLCQLQTSFEII